MASCFKVDSKMIPSKLAYFLFWAGYSHYIFFINSFLTSIRLTAAEAGFITGIGLASASIAGPILGAVGDHTQNRNVVFLLLCISAAFSYFSLPWIASKIESTTPYGINTTANGLYNATDAINNHDPGSHDTNISPFSSMLFWVMLASVIVVSLFLCPLAGFLDSIVMNIVTNTTEASYGIQRLFGSVGDGTIPMLAGFLVDKLHPATSKYSTNMSKYDVTFYTYLPCMLLLIPTGLYLFKQTNWEANGEDTTAEESAEEQPSSNKTKLLLSVFRNTDNIVFMISVVIGGTLLQVSCYFLAMLMTDEMHSGGTEEGIAMFVIGMTEILMFPFAKKLIALLGGPIPAMLVGFICYFSRHISLSYIENAWLAILPQLLHMGFALFYEVVMQYTESISPKEMHTTMYTIITALHYHLPGLLSNICAGIVYNYYNGRVLYRATACLAVGWAFLVFLYFYGVKWIKLQLGGTSNEENVV